MSPSEIAFLALGLVLGAAIGAALVQLARTRPAPRREVRLTITPNAIPARRAQTLAVAYGAAYPGPIPGSPEDTRLDSGPGRVSTRWPVPGPSLPSGGPGSRTRVPNPPISLPATAVGVPVGGPAAGPAREPRNGSAGPDARAMSAVSAVTAIAILEPPTERAATTMAAGAVPESAVRPRPARPDRDDSFTTLARPRAAASDVRPSPASEAVAVAALATATAARASSDGTQPAGGPDPDLGGADPVAGAPGTALEPCAGQRRIVDERCALADVAREQARRAADALREAQRAYDTLRERVDNAHATADPRRVAAEKERLHAAFRSASDRAGGPDDTELAARAWLTEVNTLNAAVREAARIIEAGSAELRALLPALERRSAEADAARIAAENAESGCRDAREELAACEEAEARAREAAAVPLPEEEPHPFARVWPEDSPELRDSATEPPVAATGLPLVVRVLRGEREARDRLVASLGGGDADAQREWGLRISRLVDAIVGRAIEDGYLDLPEDDPFWRLFERREARDIVGALSALGFRYDGLGGFADGRVPAARDLSLAVGYAGLDRMRIRTWPGEADLSRLYGRAVVAADEWLADQAGDLSLGRMVDALGGRASELTDVWNAWGRVRPALLAP